MEHELRRASLARLVHRDDWKSPFSSHEWAETLFRDDLEGIALFGGGGRHASFDWEAKDKNVGAYIHFNDASGALDTTCGALRCESVRCSGESYPAQMSKDESPVCQILLE